MDKITCENIESHTKEQIQNENVKNGLARSAKESKEKSVKKWRKNYIKQNVTFQEANKMIQELEQQIIEMKKILNTLTDVN